MTPPTLGDFLLPDGFGRPPVVGVLREGSLVGEVGRYALRSVGERGRRRATPWSARHGRRGEEPVLLVPGFMAGDASLALMGRALRARGLRTYRSHIRANIGCTVDAAGLLETRLESIAAHRGSRVRLVGHSLGGMLARGVAARRPDLVSGLVTMGSPILAPAAHHVSLSASVDLLCRLSRAGVPRVMSADCVGGVCARQSFEEARAPLAPGTDFTCVYSRRDGIVDWRACIDPLGEPVEVSASHVGMAVDPRVIDVVRRALQRPAASLVEVDRGEIA